MKTPAFELTIRVFDSPGGAPFISCIIGDGLEPARIPPLALAAGRSLIKLFGDGEPSGETGQFPDEPLDDFPPEGYPGPIFTETEDDPYDKYDWDGENE